MGCSDSKPSDIKDSSIVAAATDLLTSDQFAPVREAIQSQAQQVLAAKQQDKKKSSEGDTAVQASSQEEGQGVQGEASAPPTAQQAIELDLRNKLQSSEPQAPAEEKKTTKRSEEVTADMKKAVEPEAPREENVVHDPQRGVVREADKEASRSRALGAIGTSRSGVFGNQQPAQQQHTSSASPQRQTMASPMQAQHQVVNSPMAPPSPQLSSSMPVTQPVDDTATAQLKFEREALQVELQKSLRERDAAIAETTYLKKLFNVGTAAPSPDDPYAKDQLTIAQLSRDLYETQRVLVNTRHAYRRLATRVQSAGAPPPLPNCSDTLPLPESPTELSRRITALREERRVLDAKHAQESERHATFVKESTFERTKCNETLQKLRKDVSLVEQRLVQVRKEVADLEQNRAQMEGKIRALEAQGTELARESKQLTTAIETSRVQLRSVEAELEGAKGALTTEQLKKQQEEDERQAKLRLEAEKSKSPLEQAKASPFVQGLLHLIIEDKKCPLDVKCKLCLAACEAAQGVRLAPPTTTTAGGAKAPPPPSSTQVLDLGGIMYGDSMAFVASMVVRSPSSTVEELHLCDTSMTDIGIGQLAVTLSLMNFATKLRVISLGANEITARGAIQLLTTLGSAGSSCAQRRGCASLLSHPLTVDLDNNPIFDTVDDVLLILQEVEKMKSDPRVASLVKVTLPPVPKELLSHANQRTGSVFVGL